MISSRSPERRGALKKGVLFLGLPVVAVIAAGLIIFFSGAFDSTLTESEEPVGTVVAAQSSPAPTTAPPVLAVAPKATTAPTPRPTSAPAPAPTATPTPAPTATPAPEPTEQAKPAVEPQETTPAARVVPQVKFGEVLADGWIKLELPGDNLVDAWYTLQVNTTTLGITNFFALYDDASGSIFTTVKIPNYKQGDALDNAQVILHYPGSPERVLKFDAIEGNVTLSQKYPTPFGPSVFPPDLRVALVYYGVQLRDEAGNIAAELDLDFSGLSDGEGLKFIQHAPTAVNSVLREIGSLVTQIEKQRKN